MSVTFNTPTRGTSLRRVSLLKKFGNCLTKRVSTVTVESPIAATTELLALETGNSTGDARSKDSRGSNNFDNKKDANFMKMPSPVLTKKKGYDDDVGSGGSSTFTLGGYKSGIDMKQLLGELQQSRLRFEKDERSLEKTRKDIKDVDTKIAGVKLEAGKADRKFKGLVETAAIKRTDLHAAEIQCKVLDETLKKSEENLNTALNELQKSRIEASKLAELYLNETVQFGLQWNGTELGKKNRLRLYQQEIENMSRQKRQLEFELSDFLSLRKVVEECESDVESLNQKYRSHDEAVSKQESNLQQQIDELNKELGDLELEENEFSSTSAEEVAQLEKQIDEMQNSINYLQEQSSNAKTVVKTPKATSKTIQNQEQRSTAQQNVKPNVTTPKAKTKKEFALRDNLKLDDFKNRFARFQVPVKAQLQTTEQINGNRKEQGCTDTMEYNSSAHLPNASSNNVFPNSESNSNDEEMCLIAAAAEISQALRDDEQIPSTGSTANGTHYGPSPAKVRAMEGQPTVLFNEQLSSTKVIKRRPKSTQSQGKNKNVSKNTPSVLQVAPLRQSIPPPRKNFQFKKRSSDGNAEAINKENSNHVDSSCIDSIARNENIVYTKAYEDKDVPELFDDLPFSRFNSSRVLLTETQEQRFGLK